MSTQFFGTDIPALLSPDDKTRDETPDRTSDASPDLHRETAAPFADFSSSCSSICSCFSPSPLAWNSGEPCDNCGPPRLHCTKNWIYIPQVRQDNSCIPFLVAPFVTLIETYPHRHPHLKSCFIAACNGVTELGKKDAVITQVVANLDLIKFGLIVTLLLFAVVAFFPSVEHVVVHCVMNCAGVNDYPQLTMQ